jgi:hypothetical protein
VIITLTPEQRGRRCRDRLDRHRVREPRLPHGHRRVLRRRPQVRRGDVPDHLTPWWAPTPAFILYTYILTVGNLDLEINA